MKKYFLLLCVLALSLLSCNHVDPNAVTGARDFCDEMLEYAETKNYDKANNCLERYWNSYSKSDQLNVFCMALQDELRSDKYHHVGIFIGNIDTEKYPLFLDFMRRYIASKFVCDKTILQGLIERIGVISLFDGFAKGYMSYDINKNVVSLLMETDQAIGIGYFQKVDKQLAIDGLRTALAKDTLLIKLMKDSNASFTLYHTNGSGIFEVAKLSPDDIKVIINHPLSDNERKDSLLTNYVAKTNSALPFQIADGVTYQSIEFKDNYILQKYHIDEKLWDVKEIETTLKAHKYDAIVDPLERNEYNIYISHGKGLRIEYYSKGSKPVIVITYTLDELKRVLN